MVAGVSKVVIEVEDQERALRFWSDAMGFELVRDSTDGEERWLEVGTPDRRLNLVLKLREGDPPSALDALPTSNVFFYCDDLPRTYGELRFGSGGNRRCRPPRPLWGRYGTSSDWLAPGFGSFMASTRRFDVPVLATKAAAERREQ